MKNFFRLEVFKDGQTIFDKMTPTIIISQTLAQWSAPDQGYSFRLTFDNGLQVNSDELFNHEFSKKTLEDLSPKLQQTINSISL